MRFIEIRGGINIPLSNEEQILYGYLEEAGSLNSEELDERGLELARLMLSRGVLNSIENEDGSITYTINNLEDIWRD